jgi:hypothetical protein
VYAARFDAECPRHPFAIRDVTGRVLDDARGVDALRVPLQRLRPAEAVFLECRSQAVGKSVDFGAVQYTDLQLRGTDRGSPRAHRGSRAGVRRRVAVRGFAGRSAAA